MRERTPYTARTAAATTALVVVGLATASSPSGAQELPRGVTRQMVEDGSRIFREAGFCYTCHGRNGGGMRGLGADLTDTEWTHIDGSYEAIVGVVRKGVSANRSTQNVPMPPMGGARLSPEQVRAVAAYVWSLSRGN